MITRTILCENIDDITYISLLSKFQSIMFRFLEAKELVIQCENNHKSFIKIKDSIYAGSYALREVFTYITDVMKYEDRVELLGYLNKYYIKKEKLTYDMSNGHIKILGNKYSGDDKVFDYYESAGYTIKVDKDIPIFYKPSHNPLLIHKKILNVDYLKEKLPTEIYEFIKTRENEKMFSVVVEDKAERMKEFVEFLDLSLKEKANIFGKILYEHTLENEDTL